jgi:Mycothiol maleylpyruvate isomerase N-terminal domain
MSDVALADLDGALAATETIVAGIAPGQWGAPTPCTGLDVRTLVNHPVAGDLIFAARVTATPLPAPVAVGRRVDPVRARGARPRQRARD